MIRRPTEQEELLLLSALGPADIARESWLRVASALDVTTLPYESHAVLPLLARGLRRLGFDYADKAKLEGVRKRAWYVNSRRLHSVANALGALAADGVSPFVTGGLGVLLLEGDLGLRWLAAADVVLDRGGHAAAGAALDRAGWVRRSGRRDGFLLDLHGEVWSSPDRNEITLRWGDGGWPYDGFPQAGQVSPAGAEGLVATVAAPADLLAFTLIDAPRMPGYTPVRIHADALQLLPRIDAAGWQRFIDVAVTRRAVLPLRDTLQYLSQRLHGAVPVQVLEDSAWQSVTAWDRLAVRASGSDTVAAYLRRRTTPAATTLPGFLMEIWEVPRHTQLPGAAFRRVRTRLR